MSEPETPQRDEQPLTTPTPGFRWERRTNADDTHVARGVDENTHVKGPGARRESGLPATGRDAEGDRPNTVESVATVRIDCTNAPNDRVDPYRASETTIEAFGVFSRRPRRRRSRP